MTEGVIDPRVDPRPRTPRPRMISPRAPRIMMARTTTSTTISTSVVIELPEIADVDALAAAIRRLAREQNMLRVKGYIAVAGKPMRLLVQAVGERVRASVRPAVGRSAARSRSWW